MTLLTLFYYNTLYTHYIHPLKYENCWLKYERKAIHSDNSIKYEYIGII